MGVMIVNTIENIVKTYNLGEALDSVNGTFEVLILKIIDNSVIKQVTNQAVWKYGAIETLLYLKINRNKRKDKASITLLVKPIIIINLEMLLTFHFLGANKNSVSTLSSGIPNCEKS